LQALEILKTKAEVRKLSAEAQRAEIDSLLPKLPTELPSGKLDAPTTGSPIGVLAAYRAIDSISQSIVKAIPSDIKRLWIVPDDRVVRYRSVYRLVTSQLERCETAIQEAGKLIAEPSDKHRDFAPLVPVLAGLSVAASALPALMSFFKSDITVRTRDVTVTFTSLAASVAGSLLSKAIERPKVTIAGVSSPLADEIEDDVVRLATKRDDLARNLSDYRAKHVDEPGADLAAATERLATLKTVFEAEAKKDASKITDDLPKRIEEAARDLATKRQNLARHVAAADLVDQVIEVIDGFLNQSRTADASGLTPLTVAAVYAANSKAYVLVLEPSFAGGETQWEAKTGKDRALHLGALVVSYVLADEQGDVVASGAETAHGAASTVVGEPRIDWG
jgi:hypothetical protein